MKESLCTGTLFIDPYASARDRKDLSGILDQFEMALKPFDGSVQLDLAGYEFDQIREGLVEKVAEYLDSSRKSSLLFFSDSGELSTVIIQDGEILYA